MSMTGMAAAYVVAHPRAHAVASRVVHACDKVRARRHTMTYDPDRDLIPTPTGELWMGGTPDYRFDRELLDFDLIVNATFNEEWPDVFGAGVYIRLPLADSDIELEDAGTVERLRSVAGLVAGYLVHDMRVLVHCTMGLNRSGLVVGTTLLNLGMPGGDVIQHIRDHRVSHRGSTFALPPLFNVGFARWLEAEGGVGQVTAETSMFGEGSDG